MAERVEKIATTIIRETVGELPELVRRIVGASILALCDAVEARDDEIDRLRAMLELANAPAYDEASR